MLSTKTVTTNSVNISPLQNGDRLNRLEFERHYTAMPNLKKAELIEGLVYLGSPIRITKHGKPHAEMTSWLGYYAAFMPNVQIGNNCTVRLDLDNEPQPDILLRIKQGGQSVISVDDYVKGAPELVAEIAASSVSMDLHQKLNLYRRHQVQEYIVWRVEDEIIDWFRLRDGEYVKLAANKKGILTSEIFPKLCLDVEALLAGNMAKVLQTLQANLSE